ncbi:MAG: aldehyde dehydrogenase family protein [Gammaproteobacteria bacterium]|nr:aldehyde dehydrogenase family protein [Gammaproteobacteria bacterium]
MSRFQTISPVDGSVYVERSYATEKEIADALETAATAQRAWSRLPIVERVRICNAATDAFVAMKSEIAEELTWQMGRPIASAPGEVAGFEERARYMSEVAETALAPERVEAKSGFNRYIRHEPVGVVFVMAPWNYPYLTSVNAIVPALLAGNAVILKHSVQTPLCAERYAEAFAAAGLPDGVFQYLHTTHDSTRSIIQSDRVNFVAFTGSVSGGRNVEQSAAGRFIGMGLELGGKDPAYVRADANFEHAIETTVDGAFFNSGQSCCGIERIYVEAPIYDRFIEDYIDLVRQYNLDRPDRPDTNLGPLVKTSAAEFVREQIRDAVAAGAQAHIDPGEFSMDAAGSPYMAPQVLTQVDHSMRVMTEESFGPVVGIMSVANDDEAIELMNDSDFGLTAAVFTTDEDAAISIGNRVETGTWFMNRCDYLDPALAWTGVKDSGRGCTLSSLGYGYLTRPKSYHLKVKV